MKKIIYIPLEDIEERYTPMFNNAFKSKCDYYLYPEFEYGTKIEDGEFLDINKTIIFKSKQLTMISELFYKKIIGNGDIFIVGDIFFPGIESIKYMAELQGLNVKVAGFNHAGRSDPDDFVQKLSSWSDSSEKGYHESFDLVFFGSEFHRIRTVNYFNLDQNSTCVTGMIWDSNYINSIYKPSGLKKEDVVVWPHRISKEKGFGDFLKIAKQNPSQKFLITSSGREVNVELPENITYLHNLSKAQYYQILDESKYYLSTAYQETFGYTLQEAIHYGCKVAVPDRACYPEMVSENCLFNNESDIEYCSVSEEYKNCYDGNVYEIIEKVRKL
jgi:glycosyltransferase involved in cell wall biosynthesis